jgi:2-aminomuconate deaminase
MREVNGFLYVSGLSSRRPDNTHIGAVKNDKGEWQLDIAEQTEGVLDNLSDLLIAAGADLGHLVDVNVFLTDMSLFPAYNKVYNAYFDAQTGPTRTTVAVKALPHPNILIEIKAVAVAPRRTAAAAVAHNDDM